MKRPITADEYKLLKIFPKNGKYLKRSEVEKAGTKVLDIETFNKVIQDLYVLEYLTGHFNGVGMRIMPDRLKAVSIYRSTKKKWYKSTDLWIKIITALIAILGLIKLLIR